MKLQPYLQFILPIPELDYFSDIELGAVPSIPSVGHSSVEELGKQHFDMDVHLMFDRAKRPLYHCKRGTYEVEVVVSPDLDLNYQIAVEILKKAEHYIKDQELDEEYKLGWFCEECMEYHDYIDRDKFVRHRFGGIHPLYG